MRLPAFAVLAMFLVARPAPAADDDADVVVRKWLVLAPVDVVRRGPITPDAVFAKYLLDRTSAPPKEGDEIAGTLGKPAKWTTRGADEKGDVQVDDGSWAYASVESATERVEIAQLEGAATLFVGGAGFTGDIDRLGDAGVPVALKKGANDVYVTGTRGGFKLTLTKPKLDLVCGRWTFPDLTAGTPWSCALLNATTQAARNPDERRPPLVPLGCGRSDFDGPKPEPSASRGLPSFIKIKLGNGESPCVECPNAGPNDRYRRTFVSRIDGSVQSYALVPPAPGAPEGTKKGLVLSLHGAGVECMDMARAYASKPDFWIVCPTGRGRYGFDWQDWGRLDANEVLEDALKVTGVDPRRVYLTGHGVRHIAANDPDRFVAIAPSEELSDSRPPATSPLAWMWRAADGAAQTSDLAANLAGTPTYVLASGADAVDSPGMWELFRKTQPADAWPIDSSVTRVPSSDWLWDGLFSIEQAMDCGRPMRVTTKLVDHHLFIYTENVRALRVGQGVDPARALNLWGVQTITLDGARFGPVCEFVRSGDGTWKQDSQWMQRLEKEKWGHQAGPFKAAFRNRFVLVYGTAGDESENRELLEKARYDSEVWAYRANGDANLTSDAQFLAGDFKDRNVIVYGNADTNRAWSAVFDDDCPIVANRGVMTVGGVKHEGVVAAAFVRPRRGSSVALAAAFADTGSAAARLFYEFPVFVSGVGIPDYVVFGPGFLEEMDGDVRAAGWFDYAWRLR